MNYKLVPVLVALIVAVVATTVVIAVVVAARTTIVAAAWATIVVTTWTVTIAWATVATWAIITTATLLLITLGLILQSTHREAEFAGLLVNLDELNSHLVALVQATSLHVGKALPAYLADVKQTFLAWHELNKSTKLKDALDWTSVYSSLLGHCDDGLNALNCSLDAVFVSSRDFNLALAVNLIDCDDSTSLLLDALDNLATLPMIAPMNSLSTVIATMRGTCGL